MVTTWAVPKFGYALNGQDFCHRYISGTSLAAPHISGVAGLMLSANPSLTPADLTRLLRKSAEQRPVLDCPAGNCGAGLVDANLAVRSARAELKGPSVTPTLGAWWNPARSGNGLDLQRMPNGEYGAVWYTYREDGSPIWYISDVAPIIRNRWEATLYESRWPPGAQTHVLREIGEIGLTLSDSTHAMFRWEIPTAPDTTLCLAANQGQEPFEVYHFGGTEQNGPATGLWGPPSEPGWGASISQRGQTVVLTLYMYDSEGKPTWVQGLEEGSTQSLVFNSVYQPVNGKSLCPGCVGNEELQYPRVGEASLALPNPGGNEGQLTVDVDYASTTTPGGWDRTVPPVPIERRSRN